MNPVNNLGKAVEKNITYSFIDFGEIVGRLENGSLGLIAFLLEDC